ncbi:MAG: hypothetical protein WC784_02435 [Candidatus Shapirobacteria bacterium]
MIDKEIKNSLFAVISKIVEHDRQTSHFWSNTGHLCHECNSLIGLYRQIQLEISDNELVEKGFSLEQASRISDLNDEYHQELNQKLSD